nr:MAG TPA: hypothetical protein [Bacteriophage sp.]DAU45387.1 MAG TPA: hypothetical protein [Caudoviricetes sp.]
MYAGTPKCLHLLFFQSSVLFLSYNPFLKPHFLKPIIEHMLVGADTK